MSYLDDKIEAGNDDARSANTSTARSNFKRLCARFGSNARPHPPCPATVEIRSMDPIVEVWALDGPQVGINFKEKMYRRIK